MKSFPSMPRALSIFFLIKNPLNTHKTVTTSGGPRQEPIVALTWRRWASEQEVLGQRVRSKQEKLDEPAHVAPRRLGVARGWRMMSPMCEVEHSARALRPHKTEITKIVISVLWIIWMKLKKKTVIWWLWTTVEPLRSYTMYYFLYATCKSIVMWKLWIIFMYTTPKKGQW